MNMTDWAKREIEIACARERGDKNTDEWDYGCACYESAYKAFQSLVEDEHSGMSIRLTQNILNRLNEAVAGFFARVVQNGVVNESRLCGGDEYRIVCRDEYFAVFNIYKSRDAPLVLFWNRK